MTFTTLPQKAKRHVQHECVAGVTLVEMLLVIAVIAVISLTGIEFLQHQNDSEKADTTSQEIQNIMVAVRDFYEYKKAWPATLTDIASHASNIEANTKKNPFGKDYEVSGATPPVTITTEVPSARLASRIAARLPFSYIDTAGGKFTVTVAMTKPSRVAWIENTAAQAYLLEIEETGALTHSSGLSKKTSTVGEDIWVYTPTKKPCAAGFTDKRTIGLKSFGYKTEADDPNRDQTFSHFSLCGNTSENTPTGSNSDDDVCLNYKPTPAAGDDAVSVLMWGTVSEYDAWAKLVVFHFCEVTPPPPP